MSSDKTIKNEAASTVRYWWNLALFAREFEAEGSAPPIEVARRLQNIQQPIKGLMLRKGRSVKVVEVEPETLYEFDVRMLFRSRGVNYTTVKATGRIVYSQGYETTIVRGSIRLGWLFYFVLLLSTVISPLIVLGGELMSPTFSPFPAASFLFGAVFLMWSWWIVYSDYRTLTRTILEEIGGLYAPEAQLSNEDETLEDGETEPDYSHMRRQLKK